MLIIEKIYKYRQVKKKPTPKATKPSMHELLNKKNYCSKLWYITLSSFCYKHFYKHISIYYQTKYDDVVHTTFF